MTDTSIKFQGSRYEETKGLSNKEIAKLVRAELRKAVKAGDFPEGTKFSVRTRSCGYTGAIDVEITELPGIAIVDADGERDGAAYRVWEDRADRILQAYQLDRSDSMTDYFDVRYYGHAKMSHDLIGREQDRVRANKGDHRASLRLLLDTFGQDNAWTLGLDRRAKDDDEVGTAAVYLDAVLEGRDAGPMPDLVRKAFKTKAARKKGARKGLPLAV